MLDGLAGDEYYPQWEVLSMQFILFLLLWTLKPGVVGQKK